MAYKFDTDGNPFYKDATYHCELESTLNITPMSSKEELKELNRQVYENARIKNKARIQSALIAFKYPGGITYERSLVGERLELISSMYRQGKPVTQTGKTYKVIPHNKFRYHWENFKHWLFSKFSSQ